ncbi:MAG TPA: IS5/IS1182 family transposase [Gemmataceae bacterium]|jgi:transposase|nr:IS5/IS1182 family transposase [Gemmataceae bacterium]
MPRDDLLADDHQARVVWRFVEGLDLTNLYARIRAVAGHPGRSPADPRILTALWLHATLEGVGRARALDYLCTHHHAFRWRCGGVSVNYHSLSDFRVQHLEFLDDLLTHSVAVWREQDLVDLNRVAQDGRRVRASAGAASFRRRPTLEECQAEAHEQGQRLRAELEDDPGAGQRRQQKAPERAAREREERLRQALERLPELEAKKKADEKTKARCSSTDPEATVLKMADGGFRPAYNFQFATATARQVIVGVEVTTSGSDQGQLAPMVEQVHERVGQRPQEALGDGGFASHADIEAVSAPDQGCGVYAPVPEPKDPTRDRYTPVEGDSPAVAAWRVRMGTAPAQAISKDRAASAECVTALARNRGLRQLTVRGRLKAKAIALWYAIAHNLRRAVSLRAALVVPG